MLLLDRAVEIVIAVAWADLVGVESKRKWNKILRIRIPLSPCAESCGLSMVRKFIHSNISLWVLKNERAIVFQNYMH